MNVKIALIIGEIRKTRKANKKVIIRAKIPKRVVVMTTQFLLRGRIVQNLQSVNKITRIG